MSFDEISYTYICDGITANMMYSLLAYRDQGRPVGDFLQAVISNDFMRAAGHADDVNRSILYLYARWFYNEAPTECYGSKEAYQKWIEKVRVTP